MAQESDDTGPAGATRNVVGGDARTGSVVQAGRIGAVHQHVHLAAPTRLPSRYLPAESAHFEDRHPEQALLVQAVERRTVAGGDPDGDQGGASGDVGGDAGGGPQRPLVAVVSGVDGVGKTALGVRLAHRLTALHPDGVLFADLDETRRDPGGGAAVSEVLAVLLGQLEVREPWLAREFHRRHDQYRARTAGQRLLVVLDNVRHAAEVEPLLPASAASTAIVISRARLPELEGEAAIPVPLAPLAASDALTLLRKIAGGERAASLTAEPAAAQDLLRICGGLPAALRVAGRWLRRHRRRTVRKLVADLEAELTERGLPEVEAVWDAAYRELTQPAARLYLLLAGHPTGHFPPQAAAALLGLCQDDADDALDELATASLVEARRDGRYHFHELLRSHARRRAAEGGEGGEPRLAREAALRLIGWYRRQAERADALATGQRLRFAEPAPPLPCAADVPLADAAAARAWLEEERHALYGCVRWAYEHGADADAWALCEPLWTHFLDHRPYADAEDAFRTGLAAAGRAGQPAAQARLRCQLARSLWEQGRFDEADKQVRQAVTAAEALGTAADPRLLPSTVEFGGLLLSARGDWAGAAASFERARAMHRSLGNDYGVLLQTHLLGRATARVGEPHRAAELLTEAHTMARAQRRERLIGRTAHELGLVRRALGDLTGAADLLRQALENARGRRSSFDEAHIHRDLAELAEAAGDPAGAAAHREAARALREHGEGTAGAGPGAAPPGQEPVSSSQPLPSPRSSGRSSGSPHSSSAEGSSKPPAGSSPE